MHAELEVLKIVSEKLEAAHVPFMLTGSFAMAYYGQPRMTRDIDLVVYLKVDFPSSYGPEKRIRNCSVVMWNRCSMNL